MISDFMTGARHAFGGFKWLLRPKVRAHALLPLLINAAIFSGGFYVGAMQFQALMNALLPDWEWLRWLLWPLFGVGALLILTYGFLVVASVVSSPFNGPLAAAVTRHLAGEADTSGRAPSVMVALMDELKRLAYFIGRAFPILLLFIVPGVNLIAPVVWTLLTGWLLAMEFFAYPWGNRGIDFKEQRRLLGERRAMSLGFGLGVLLLAAIPVVNLVALPAAVAGAAELEWRRRSA